MNSRGTTSSGGREGAIRKGGEGADLQLSSTIVISERGGKERYLIREERGPSSGRGPKIEVTPMNWKEGEGSFSILWKTHRTIPDRAHKAKLIHREHSRGTLIPSFGSVFFHNFFLGGKTRSSRKKKTRSTGISPQRSRRRKKKKKGREHYYYVGRKREKTNS